MVRSIRSQLISKEHDVRNLKCTEEPFQGRSVRGLGRHHERPKGGLHPGEREGRAKVMIIIFNVLFSQIFRNEMRRRILNQREEL